MLDILETLKMTFENVTRAGPLVTVHDFTKTSADEVVVTYQFSSNGPPIQNFTADIRYNIVPLF